MTVVALTIIFTFILIKTAMFIDRHNPNFSQATIPEFYDSTSRFEFDENNYQIAIAVVEYKSRKPINDPEYVRWVPQLVRTIDNIKTELPLSYHKCNEDDWAKFYSPSRRSKTKL